MAENTSSVSNVPEFPKIPRLPVSAFPEDVRATIEQFNLAVEEWYVKINGGISIGDSNSLPAVGQAASGHIRGQLIRFRSPVAGSDFAIPHNLGRIPLGFTILDRTDAAGIFRNPSTPDHTDRLLWMRTGAPAGTIFLIWVV